jgi:ribosomal-protein-alanine N-acetyltransferase
MTKNSKTCPILITERLTLRQLSKSDSEQILQLRSDTEINKYLNRKPSKTIEDAQSFISSIIENSENQELFYWAITKTEEEKLIGTICLFDFLNEQKKGEIGYELLTEYQRQGIMTEATKKVIAYATQTLGLKTIDASTHKENQSSIKLLQEIDFKPLDDINQENANVRVFRLTI